VSNITGLIANTLYYIRAYATNSAGISYGAQLSFTTLAQTTTLPKVTTNTVTNIKSTTATCGGNVTSDGGAAVSARGVCWSISPNPTLNNSHSRDGSGIGTFTSYLTSLSKHTVYYVRAYATNLNGTAYGNQQSFTTEYHWYDNIIDTSVAQTTPAVQEVEPNTYANTLIIYPNPVVSNLTISLTLIEKADISLSVYNLTGIKMYSEQLGNQESGVHNIQLNVSSYLEGLYVVRITTNSTILEKKFIKIN
jgi:hypothetical protein